MKSELQWKTSFSVLQMFLIGGKQSIVQVDKKNDIFIVKVNESACK